MNPTILRSTRVVAIVAALLLATTSVAAPECTKPFVLGAALTFASGLNAGFPIAGDFNEDGIPDFAVVNSDNISPGGVNSSLTILIGTGSRGYAPAVQYTIGRGGRDIVTGDFNEDGITDIAVANYFTNNISVLLGNGTAGIGNGTFGPATNFDAGSGPFGLATADFNGDGILDLATSLNTVSSIEVLPGLGNGGVGNGTFGARVSFPVASISTSIAVGDFNGDLIPDLVATEIGGNVAVLLGTGAGALGPGSFDPAAHYAAGPSPFYVHVADFNEDGHPDLAVANTGAGGIRILVGSSSGSFVSGPIVGSGNNAGVTSADLNQDGILDLITGVVTGSNGGEARVAMGHGTSGIGDGTFGSPVSYFTGGDVYHVVAGDFDGDGLIDALTAQGWGNNVVLLPGFCSDVPPDPRKPVLTDVRDVPNDNGGQVFLTWLASSLDVTGGAVNQYRVWRRIPPAMASRAVTPRRLALGEILAIPHLGEATLIDYWEALATLPAQRIAGYGYTAATTQDSIKNSNPYTAFFVSALTSNIDVFYSSEVDSGYSVDNLKPHKPGNLAGTATAEGFALTWEAVEDPDLEGYRLYRGSTDTFVPSESSLLATPTEPEWLDAGAAGEWYYKLTAIDAHGNESDVAELARIVGIGPEGPVTELALIGAHPNPSLDGRLAIHFALPDHTPARLDLVDLAGRRIVSVDLATWGIGRHVATLGESAPLRPGIYFARLIQGRQSRESKVVVAR